MSLSAILVPSHSLSHSNGLSRLSKVRKHSHSPRPNPTNFSRRNPCEVSPGARATICDALIRHMGFDVLPTVTTTTAKKSQRQRRSLRQRPRERVFQVDLHRTAGCPWVSSLDYLSLDRRDLVNTFLRHHDHSIVADNSPFFTEYFLEGTRLEQIQHLRACFSQAHARTCDNNDNKRFNSAKFELPEIPDEAQLLELLCEDDPDLEEPEEDPDVELTDCPPLSDHPSLDEHGPESALEAAGQLLVCREGTAHPISAWPVLHSGEAWGNALPSIERQQADPPTQNEVKKSWRRNVRKPQEKPKMKTVVCRYFQQGNCRYGDRCRYEHPRDQGSGASSNPFGSLNNNQNQNQNQGGNQNARDLLDKYKIDLDVVRKDLTTEPPQWILSAYGPGRDTPEQLFGGSQREQSSEEMRLHYYASKASGTEQQALAQAQELWQNAQQQMQTAAQNLSQAGNFIIEAENKHPNRHDICREGTQGAPFGKFLVGRTSNTASSNPFGAPSTTTSSNPFGAPSQSNASPFGAASSNTSGSAFGQPSTMGAKPNPFGAPAQANQTQGSAFGQPSQMGNTSGSAFGQPSQMGQQTSAFGQPSTMGAKPNPFGAPAQANQTQGSAFGQPSQMGSTGGSAFGQASQMGSTGGSAFGKPSTMGSGGGAFGQPSQTNTSGSAFGQPSQMGSTGGSAFGQPSTMGSGGSAFGQPSQMGNQGSAFGQASQMGQKPSPFGSNTASTATANPFASSASTTTNASPFATAGNNASAPAANPFGQPSQPAAPAANPFASTSNNQSSSASNPFASKPAQASPFGQPSTQQSNASPFGQPAQQPQTANPFGQPSQAANPFGSASAAPAGTNAELKNPYPEGSSKQHPKDYIKKDANGTTVSFKGQAVTLEEAGKYVVRGMGGKTTRVWFPDGPPAYSAETEMPKEMYDEKTISQWQAFEKSGNFDDGLMPELPPPRECTIWDF